MQKLVELLARRPNVFHVQTRGIVILHNRAFVNEFEVMFVEMRVLGD